MCHKPAMTHRLRCWMFAVAGVVALAGCAADRDLVAAQSACLAPSVLDEIACAKRRLEAEHWEKSPISETIGTYLAYADAVAERVRGGKLSDAEARQDLHTMLHRLRSDIASTNPYFLFWLWPA